MSVPMLLAPSSVPRQSWRWPWTLLLLSIFGMALLLRLLPAVRGDGLFGFVSYDDGVYFGSALAFVHGRWPYADFLLLHPPGIVLALSPFAGLAAFTGDGVAFAAARLAWMIMGAGTAALVAVVLRRFGWYAAALGGLAYAVYAPAIRAEQTTMLEGLTSLLLVLALLVLTAEGFRLRHARLCFVGAGVLLGLAAVTKIWGVVILAVVLVWVAIAFGARQALRFGLGAVAEAVAVVLPFFLQAPDSMWRMVVVDQMARPENGAPLLIRLAAITGFAAGPVSDPWAVVAATGLVLLAVALACRASLRVGPALVLAMGLMLLVTPSFYWHYPASLAVPLALTIGLAGGEILNWLRQRGRVLVVGLAVTTTAVLAGVGAPVAASTIGRPFPAGQLAGAMSGIGGCVTSDDPTTLIELGVFSRNVQRGCRTVVDLSGYSYDATPGLAVARSRNPAFQHTALEYLASGQVAVVTRFRIGFGYSRQTERAIARWPVVEQAGSFAVRRPVGSGAN